MLSKKHPWAYLVTLTCGIIYFVLGLIGVQIILHVSSSNMSHDEDEIYAGRLFSDALYHELSKELFSEKLDSC